jgi:hypothetical protein
MRIVAVCALCIGVAACASATPQKTVAMLSMSDPKFNSPECADIRARAVGYDDKVAERAMTGMALGLILGPFGLPMAAATDKAQDDQRKGFDREITLRCITNGEAIVAEQDAKDKADLSRMAAAREPTY